MVNAYEAWWNMNAIGGWGRRQKAGYKWHLIESLIAGDVITRCGRRMSPGSWEFTTISRAGTSDSCKQCR